MRHSDSMHSDGASCIRLVRDLSCQEREKYIVCKGCLVREIAFSLGIRMIATGEEGSLKHGVTMKNSMLWMLTLIRQRNWTEQCHI